MRRQRENKKPEQDPKNGEPVGDPEKGISGYVKEPPKWDSAQIKSFREKDIEILNYLDSIGEGIYDPDRTPGMYLKRHNGELSDRVKKQLNQHARRQKVEQDELENSEAMLKQLFGNLKKSTESD